MNIKKIELGFWNGFNFLVRRIMGPFWLVAGAYGVLWSLMTLFNPAATIDVQGVPTSDLGIKILVSLVFVFVVVFGWLFIRAQKYYPSKLRQWMKEENPAGHRP